MILPDFLVLDGGLATQLEARGHQLTDKLWSARLLRDAPDEIVAVHQTYLEAGADIITTASYQATQIAFEEAGLSPPEAQRLLSSSVELANRAVQQFKNADDRTRETAPLVAASVGPYGAYLADGSEYTGDYHATVSELTDFHRPRLDLLAAAAPDVVLCETVPSFAEAKALITLAEVSANIPVWLSFSCKDDERLCDGTPIVECARCVDSSTAISAIGVNCTAPCFISGLISRIRGETDKRIIVYPNSGERYDAASKTWSGVRSAEDFGQLAIDWQQLGASVIGGCCRTTPDYIDAVVKACSRKG